MALLILALTTVACADDRPAVAPIDRVELPGGDWIRLGETAPQQIASLTAHDSVWRKNARETLYVATADDRVVAIVVYQGGGRFPIPGFRFGASFDALARQMPRLRAMTLAERPGLVLEGSASSLYALSAPEYTTCEHRPNVTQVALVLPGHHALLESLLAAQRCEPRAPSDLP